MPGSQKRSSGPSRTATESRGGSWSLSPSVAVKWSWLRRRHAWRWGHPRRTNAEGQTVNGDLMMQTITATFENGVLKPAQPLDLPERAQVRLTIEPLVDGKTVEERPAPRAELIKLQTPTRGPPPAP